MIRDTRATPAVFAESAEMTEKRRVSLLKTASLAEVARDKKERSKSAQPIEKKRDENCTTDAKSKNGDSVEEALGGTEWRPDMGV